MQPPPLSLLLHQGMCFLLVLVTADLLLLRPLPLIPPKHFFFLFIKHTPASPSTHRDALEVFTTRVVVLIT